MFRSYKETTNRADQLEVVRSNHSVGLIENATPLDRSGVPRPQEESIARALSIHFAPPTS